MREGEEGLRAPRVRDLLDSLYRGYPSGSILIWETDNPQPSRDLDVAQDRNPFGGHKLLLDGQQRLTSLSAISFLKTRADIADENLLSSPLFLITLTYYSQVKGERMSEPEAKGLLRWLHLANARGRYGRGSSETLLDNDLKAIQKGGGPTELIEILRQQVGRLEIESSDFVVVLSPHLKNEFDNRKDYYKFHGQPLALVPTLAHERPVTASLLWHNEHTFRWSI